MTRNDQPAITPLLSAALLVAARTELRRHNLPCPTTATILDATGATRTRVYQVAGELLERLPSLVRPVGRPACATVAHQEPTATLLKDRVLEFLLANPGCVTGNKRRRYSDSFRHFILDLHRAHADMDRTEFATAVHVPIKTLQQWIHDAAQSPTTDINPSTVAEKPSQRTDTDQLVADGPRPSEAVMHAHIQTILAEYRQWKGPFTSFCSHLRDEWKLPYGRTFITRVLTTYGLRRSASRPARSPDEVALHRAFETFFPGAQWVGDGHQLTFELCGETFRFNLELCVDTHSAALVGIELSAQEDTDAVVCAFRDGVATTGEPPVALLLDNRSCNHTDEVSAAVAPSELIRATLGRPQNKAHVEGAFGLFEQVAPTLCISAATKRDLAAAIVRLLVQVWARTLNHKPRHDCHRSRVQLYQQSCPTPEQIEHARSALSKRRILQEKAYQTQLARQNPVARTLLQQAFSDLNLSDPDGQLQLAIARYPLDAIVEGVSLFKAKAAAATLPDNPNPRYLLGIVRNLATDREQLALADELVRARIHARECILQPLCTLRDALLRQNPCPSALIDSFTASALQADSSLLRLFWLLSIADLIRRQPPPDHQLLLAHANSRIRTTYRAPANIRQQAILYLARAVFPLQ